MNYPQQKIYRNSQLLSTEDGGPHNELPNDEGSAYNVQIERIG